MAWKVSRVTGPTFTFLLYGLRVLYFYLCPRKGSQFLSITVHRCTQSLQMSERMGHSDLLPGCRPPASILVGPVTHPRWHKRPVSEVIKT